MHREETGGKVNDETKHVSPAAPRTLTENPLNPFILMANESRESWVGPCITRGIPIEKLPEGTMGSETIVIGKINELIDRINAMNVR